MIPTAEEYVNNRFTKQISGDITYPDIYASKESIIESHILFAKLCVEAALKVASENAKTKEDVAIFAEGTYRIQVVDKDSILNAYPLENIK